MFQHDVSCHVSKEFLEVYIRGKSTTIVKENWFVLLEVDL